MLDIIHAQLTVYYILTAN